MAQMASVEQESVIVEEAMTREELLAAIDEQAKALGYEPGQFLEAVRAGTVPDTPQTGPILVLASLFV
jgi:hypothetical protein